MIVSFQHYIDPEDNSEEHWADDVTGITRFHEWCGQYGKTVVYDRACFWAVIYVGF
jgi:hypothetical protein